MAWLAALADANAARLGGGEMGALRSVGLGASDGFCLNLVAVVLRMARPFVQGALEGAPKFAGAPLCVFACVLCCCAAAARRRVETYSSGGGAHDGGSPLFPSRPRYVQHKTPQPNNNTNKPMTQNKQHNI